MTNATLARRIATDIFTAGTRKRADFIVRVVKGKDSQGYSIKDIEYLILKHLEAARKSQERT